MVRRRHLASSPHVSSLEASIRGNRDRLGREGVAELDTGLRVGKEPVESVSDCRISDGVDRIDFNANLACHVIF